LLCAADLRFMKLRLICSKWYALCTMHAADLNRIPLKVAGALLTSTWGAGFAGLAVKVPAVRREGDNEMSVVGCCGNMSAPVDADHVTAVTLAYNPRYFWTGCSALVL
jgi:hypothetical protein